MDDNKSIEMILEPESIETLLQLKANLVKSHLRELKIAHDDEINRLKEKINRLKEVKQHEGDT